MENDAPALVAQAVPPATCDFFTASKGAVADDWNRYFLTGLI
jgi:hypothetical protein